MNSIITSTLLGFLVGMAGTGIGGTAAFLLRRPSRRFTGTILGMAGGLMMAIVCFELLPEAFEIAGLAIGIVGIILGVALITLIDMMIKKSGVADMRGYSDGYTKSGLLLGLGIAIHNFPEGLAIGAGLAANVRLGLSLAFVIGFHNVPEGIAMAMPLIVGGYSRGKVFLATIIAGVPLGFGAFVGALLGEISPALVALCLSFAGGTMLFITCSELIPKSRDMYRGRASIFGIIAGLIAGIVLTAI